MYSVCRRGRASCVWVVVTHKESQFVDSAELECNMRFNHSTKLLGDHHALSDGMGCARVIIMMKRLKNPWGSCVKTSWFEALVHFISNQHVNSRIC